MTFRVIPRRSSCLSRSRARIFLTESLRIRKGTWAAVGDTIMKTVGQATKLRYSRDSSAPLNGQIPASLR